MGLEKNELEITSTVSAGRKFKGLVLEFDNIIPKAAPGAYKNVEFKEDGDVGTIKYVVFYFYSWLLAFYLQTLVKDTRI